MSSRLQETSFAIAIADAAGAAVAGAAIADSDDSVRMGGSDII